MALAMLLLLPLLESCSGDGGTPAPGAGYFPLLEGARWNYTLDSELGSIEVEVELVGERDLPGGLPRAFLVEERTSGSVLGFAEVAPVAYFVQEGYVARIEGIGYDADGKLRALGQSDPTRILPLDPQPGHSWGQDQAMFTTPEGGGAEISWSAEVRERTSVRVPAGRFDDVVEVVTRFYEGGGAPKRPKIVYHDFYAPGVGLVKSRTLDPGGDESHTIEQVLVSYEFPGS